MGDGDLNAWIVGLVAALMVLLLALVLWWLLQLRRQLQQQSQALAGPDALRLQAVDDAL